jgi:ferritin-like metal-binding protein YciE
MPSETVRLIFITALRNTHALEQEALQIMERQVERIQNYPEVKQMLSRHIEETHGQRRRIEEVLSALGESTSTLKETVLGFVGNLAALAHLPAQDEILKNTFANHAFENYEIAAYKSLIAIAEAAGHANLSGFQQSLKEEQAMAQWLSENVEPITRQYLTLSQEGTGANAKL